VRLSGGSPENEAKVLANRAVIHAQRGDLDAAEADIAGAAAIYEVLGDSLRLAEVAHNRGYVAARRGDLGAALRHFDDSQRRMGELGVQRPELLLDRADTLAQAGLFREAEALIEAAVPILEERGQQADLAEACLSAARACLGAGHRQAANGWARRAEGQFVTQQRMRWVPVAVYYAALANPEGADRHRAGQLLELSADLRAAGWRLLGDEADEEAVSLLIRAGEVADAAAPLARLARLRRGAPHLERCRAWMVEARVRAAQGRVQGAARAMDAAVRALVTHQAGVGSMELRTYGAGRAESAIALAVSLGRTMSSPRPALRWVEQIRSTQEPRPVKADPQLARHLEQLRNVTVQLLGGPLEAAPERRLRAKRLALEELVVRQARHATTSQGTPVEPVEAVLGELDGRSLIEYVATDGGLGAIVVEAGHCRLVDLGRADTVRRAVAGLRMMLVGLITDPSTSRRTQGDGRRDRRSFDALLGQVADLLVAPLELDERSPEVVVVPCGTVASVPWAVLSGLAARPAAVAPSASSWLRAMRRRRETAMARTAHSVVVVAGPGLRHGQAEAEEVRRIWGSQTRVLSGDGATVGAVLDALGSTDIAHFATHGTFRGDAPLLSGLQLADGALTGYDVARLGRVPATLILSCCETGMTRSDEDGALGLSSLLLASGASSVIASVAPVADASGPGLAVPLHRSLKNGDDPGAALARAQIESVSTDPSGLGFCCFGS